MFYINGTNNQSESELIDLCGICQKTYSTLDELKKECNKFKISFEQLIIVDTTSKRSKNIKRG